jgi:hypothetical protein
MISYKKIAYTTFIVTTVGSVALLMSGSVGAITNTSNMSLSAVLAQKYNLSQSSVRSTIQQYNKTHHKSSLYEKRLMNAVKKGKITLAQEKNILIEHKQLIQSIKTAKTDTVAQKKALVKSDRSKAKSWAKTNNVPFGLLFEHHKKHQHN